MRRRRLVVAAAAATLVVAGGAWAVASASGGGEREQAGERDTATVERTTLSSATTLNGQLGYGAATAVAAAGEETVTALPAAGEVIGVGNVIYALDGRPVLALRGATPLWRDLTLGDSGDDVAALRAALAELGYDAGDQTQRTYDEALASAVGALYRDRGYPEPRELTGAEDGRREAQAALDTARAEQAQAHSALTEKQAGPGSGEIARARAAVTAAERVLAQAQAGPPPEGAAGGAEAVPSVAEATEQLDVARAELADLTRGIDTAAEEAQLAAARTAVDAAERTLAGARANGVRRAEIVFVPADAVRVDSVTATLGQAAQGTVLTWTGTSVNAYAPLTAAQAQQIAAGAEVTVVLPDNREVPGAVTAVHPAVTAEDGSTSAPTLEVGIPDQEALTGIGLPAIRIEVPAQEADDALVVPVTALLALAEGGYAVEVLDAAASGGSRLVAVELGLIADTRAQVLTDDLTPGDEVVVP